MERRRVALARPPGPGTMPTRVSIPFPVGHTTDTRAILMRGLKVLNQPVKNPDKPPKDLNTT